MIGPLVFVALVVVWALVLGRVFGGSWLPTGGRES